MYLIIFLILFLLSTILYLKFNEIVEPEHGLGPRVKMGLCPYTQVEKRQEGGPAFGQGLRTGQGPRAKMGLCPYAQVERQEGSAFGRGLRTGQGPRAKMGLCPYAQILENKL